MSSFEAELHATLGNQCRQRVGLVGGGERRQTHRSTTCIENRHSLRRLPLLRQMAQWDWEPLFDPIITPDEVTHGKPHPESLHLLQRLTGLAPDDLLMVGDTPFDLDMAREAGVPSLAVGHGFYPQSALAACGPRGYAEDTAALREILLAWTA